MLVLIIIICGVSASNAKKKKAAAEQAAVVTEAPAPTEEVVEAEPEPVAEEATPTPEPTPEPMSDLNLMFFSANDICSAEWNGTILANLFFLRSFRSSSAVWWTDILIKSAMPASSSLLAHPPGICFPVSTTLPPASRICRAVSLFHSLAIWVSGTTIADPGTILFSEYSLTFR